jgi:hypothetical protein
MKGISDFLKRFADFAPPERSLRRAVAQAIRERFSIAMTEEDVSIGSGGAQVGASGALKSEIALNKKALLARVGELTGNASPLRDIR